MTLDRQIQGLNPKVDEELRVQLQSALRVLRDPKHPNPSDAIRYNISIGLILMRLIFLKKDEKPLPNDNLFSWVEHAKEKKFLPKEVVSYFHGPRIIADKVNHVDLRIEAKKIDAELALGQLLRACEWFYCDCPFGDQMKVVEFYQYSKCRLTAAIFMSALVLVAGISGVWFFLLPMETSPLTNLLKLIYTSVPPGVSPEFRPELECNIIADETAGPAFYQVKDGDTLISDKDRFLIALNPLSKGYLYVFMVMSSGKVEWIFGQDNTNAFSSVLNPIEAKKVIVIPENESSWLAPDNVSGAEHIYIVFCTARWKQLEQKLAHAAAATALYPVKNPNGLGNRGKWDQNAQPSKSFSHYSADRMALAEWNVDGPSLVATNGFLVMERWFKHD